MKWIVRGDIDGFFGLALDNLIQMLLIGALCQFVLGFDQALVLGRIMPGVAVSLLVGNLYYAWQARRLAQGSGRSDVCALPYGINTVSLIGFVFLVMLPAKLAAEAAGAQDPSRVAWQAGLLACLGSGVIELAGALIAEKIRRATPRAALLSTLAGIAVTFIALGFLFRTFAHPIVGLATLAIILLTYFGRLRFKGSLPGGLVAVALGTLLAWITGLCPPDGPRPSGPDLFVPIPVFDALAEALSGGHLLTYVAVIVPMGIFNVIGSLQNIESAEAAGDAYPTAPSLAVNGLGTVAAACFGSCFPTTIYIGHPGWKAMGARAGYSILNAIFMTVVCLTGTLAWISYVVPIDAGMAIVLWIGIVIAAQAFEATPRSHAPAVVLGLLPGIAAWGVFLVKMALQVGGIGTPEKPFSADLIPAFQQKDIWIDGAFAIEQGFIFLSMILASVTVCVIEQKFRQAALWCLVAAGLSATGLMHAYQWTTADTVMDTSSFWQGVGGDKEAFARVPWRFAVAYVVMALCFYLAPCVTQKARKA
jgi:AGZA family xanthine/uracil permease-like MFS transporter